MIADFDDDRPCCEPGSIRHHLSRTMPLRVSSGGLLPSAMSRACVSGTRSTAFSRPGCATRASRAGLTHVQARAAATAARRVLRQDCHRPHAVSLLAHDVGEAGDLLLSERELLPR